MKIWVYVTWQVLNSGTGGSSYRGTGRAFDTNTHLIEAYTADQFTALGEPAPQAVNRPVGDVLHYECAADFTKTSWVYDGGTATHTTTEANSATCGYTPPATCDLGTASVAQQQTTNGVRLTVSLTGTSNGTLYYSLDGGQEQTGPVFAAVGTGQHQVKLRDSGLSGCERLLTVTVAAPPTVPSPPAAPIGPPEGVDFVAQPLFYTLADQAPGASVELELWAESSHYQGDYALVLPLRKQADALGRVSFRLDTLLLPLLSAFVPPPGEPVNQVTVATSANLVNYYVRTTSLAPTAGALPAYEVSALRTALRGGLPAEWQARDYFALRLSDEFEAPPFLSWQPTGPSAYATGPKPIVPRQPEWLSWLCPPEQASAQLRVRRAYAMSETGAAVYDYEPLTRPAGGWGCRLLAIPLKDSRAGFARLSVRVETLSGEALSPEAAYTFVERGPRTRFVLFTNSLGGLDTLRCLHESRLEVTLEATAESVEVPQLAAVQRAPLAGQRTSSVVANRKLRLTTGWRSPAELLWLQDLVLAPEIWQQVGAELRLLAWPKRSLATYSDEPGLRGLVLDFDYAYAPTAYAPAPYA